MVKGICHPASSDKSFPPFHLHSPYDFENAAKQIQEGIGACYEHEHEIGQCVDAKVTTDGLEVTMRVDPNINDTAKKCVQENNRRGDVVYVAVSLIQTPEVPTRGILRCC